MKFKHTSTIKNIKHFIKYFPIYAVYKILNLINLKKFFFMNDFELKKNFFNKTSTFEAELIKTNNNFLILRAENKRESVELENGKLPQNWYGNDELFHLALKYQPTKTRHDYIKWYSYHFEKIRKDVKQILEIGVYHGKSLKMWKEYFPNAKIYGLDIDPNCLKYEDERTKIFICDQNNEKDLKNVNEKLKNIDIILDDGSHKYEHMIKSFSFLFSCLKKDGFYVVEDIINNYKVLNFFTRYVYGINYFPTNTATVTEPGYDKINLKNAEDIKNTVAIHFYRHILFLQRGFNPEDNPYKNITEKQIIY